MEERKGEILIIWSHLRLGAGLARLAAEVLYHMDDPFGTEIAFYSIEKILFSVAE